MLAIDLRLDVTDAAGLGELTELVVTVTLPEHSDYLANPIVCFAKPGGGYARGYYTVDLPGPGIGT